MSTDNVVEKSNIAKIAAMISVLNNRIILTGPLVCMRCQIFTCTLLLQPITLLQYNTYRHIKMRSSCRILRHLPTPETVLTRDLFLLFPQVSSVNKVSYLGRKPSFYSRIVTDYKPDEASQGRKYRNTYIKETLEHDLHFRKHLESRTDHIQNFLGPDFKLDFNDLLCILCGISDMTIDLGTEKISLNNPVFPNLHVEHNRLRDMGERFFSLHCMSSTVFADLQHLTASQMELEHSLGCLDDTKLLITEFMRKNNLYDCLIPYRGATSGLPLDQKEYDRLRSQIKDDTAVASFYTMLGVMNARFGSQKVLDGLWNPIIMSSDKGILDIITAKLTGSDN